VDVLMVIVSLIVLLSSIIWTAFVVSGINKEKQDQDEKLANQALKFESVIALVKQSTRNYEALEEAIEKDLAYIKKIHNQTMDEFQELKKDNAASG